MASQLDAWWTCNYPRFSIRELSRLPIYHRFIQLHYPYERTNSDHSELFHCSDSEDTFQWIEQARKEKFTHFKAEDRYRYETEYKEKNYDLRVESWTDAEAEWGLVVKTYPMWELKEAWRSQGKDKTYERITVEAGISKGIKCGITEKNGVLERWVEEIWDQPEENVYRKAWEKPGASGGESRVKKGDYTWGEEWLSDCDQDRKKCWHEEHDHKWGYAQGKKGRQESWEHQWDFDTKQRFEESLSFDGPRCSGYRYTQQDADWYKQEWQGPVSIPLDKDTEITNAQLGLSLSRLYQAELAGSMKSAHTLTMLLLGSPGFKQEVDELVLKLNTFQPRARKNWQEVVQQIDELRELQDKQEALKQQMMDAQSAPVLQISQYDQSFPQLASDSLSTLLTLAPITQNDHLDRQINRFKLEIERINSDNLNPDNKLSAWKTILSDMEKTKKDNFELLERKKGEKPVEDTLRKLALMDFIRITREIIGKNVNFYMNLNGLCGDEDTKMTIDGISQGLDSHKEAKTSNDLQSLLLILGSFSPIQEKLMDNLRSGAGGQKVNDTLTVTEELVPQVKEITSQLADTSKDSTEETSFEDPFGTEISGDLGEKRPKTMSEGVADARKGVALMGPLVRKAVENRAELKGIKEALEPIVKDVRLLTEEMTSHLPGSKAALQRLPPTPVSPSPPDVLNWLQLYLPYLRSLAQGQSQGKYPSSIVMEAMKILQPAQGELKTVMRQAQGAQDVQLDALDNEAEACFQDYDATHRDTNLLRGLTALKAYFPLIRDLTRRTTTSETPSNSPSFSDTAEELQFAVSDLNTATKDLAKNNPEITHQISTLESKLPLISPENATKSDILRLIRGIRAYPPLIQAVNRDNSASALLNSIKSALNDTHRDALELNNGVPTPELAKLQGEIEEIGKEGPVNEKINAGLRVLRAYFPLFLAIRDKNFVKEIEKVTNETKEIAEEAADNEEKIRLNAIKNEALEGEKRPNFTILRKYFPLLKEMLKRKRTEPVSNPIIEETVNMLTKNSEKLQSLDNPEPYIQIFSDDLIPEIANYQETSDPESLLKAVKIFNPLVQMLIDKAEKKEMMETDPEADAAWTEVAESVAGVMEDAEQLAGDIEQEDLEAGGKVMPLRTQLAEARVKLRSSPNRENTKRAVEWMRPYFREVRLGVKGISTNGAMKILKTALQSAHREAEDYSDSPSDLLTLKDSTSTVLKNHSKAPIREHLSKAVDLLTQYHHFPLSQTRKSIWKLLKPTTEETHSLAMKLANPDDQERLETTLKSSHATFQGPANHSNLNKIWTNLKFYFDYINRNWRGPHRTSVTPDTWAEIMNLLKSSVKEVEGIGRTLSDSNPISLGKVRVLSEKTQIPVREYENSGESEEVVKTVRAVKAFYPLLQELAEGLKTRSKPTPLPSTPSDSDSTLTDTVEELKTTSEELKSIVQTLSAGSTTQIPRIQSVSTSVSKAFAKYTKSPSHDSAMKIVKSLREYHPLIVDLSGQTGLLMVLEELERAGNETHRETKEQVGSETESDEDVERIRTQWREILTKYRNDPKREHVGDLLTTLRAYYPLYRQFAWKSALRQLEPVVKATNQLAEDLSLTDTDIETVQTLKSEAMRPITESKQGVKPHHFPQTLTALQSHIPLLRRLAQNRVKPSEMEELMSILEESKEEIGRIVGNLAAGTQAAEARVRTVREDAEIPFREFGKTKEFVNIPKAAKAVKTFYPLISQLMTLQPRSEDSEIDENLLEAMRELEPAAKDANLLGRDIADDDSSHIETIETLQTTLETVLTEHKKTPRKENIVKGVKALRRYFPVLREMLGKGNRFRNIMDILEPVVKETHREAVEMTENDPSLAVELQQLERDATTPFSEYRVAYRRPQVTQALNALRAYHPFFRHFSWRYAVKRLEGVLDQTHLTAEHLTSGFPSVRDTIKFYRQEGVGIVSEHRTSPKLVHVQKLGNVLDSYMTLLKNLPRGQEGMEDVETTEEPNFSVTEAMEALEPHQKALESLADQLSEGDASYQPRLHSLRTESLQPIQQYKQSPQYIHLPRAIKALYDYHPLLQELATRTKTRPVTTDTELEALMQELELHTNEQNELIDEIEEGEEQPDDRVKTVKGAVAKVFRDHRSAPSRKHYIPAIRNIRAYHPILMELVRKMGIRAAMEALEPTITDTHRMASELAGDDSALALELHQLEQQATGPLREFKKTPRRIYYHRALKGLRDYHPFLRRYWWRRAMRHLATVVPEYDGILVKRYPHVTSRLIPLRERMASVVKDYETVYVAGKLAEGVEVLRAYHRIVADMGPEESKAGIGIPTQVSGMSQGSVQPVGVKAMKLGTAPVPVTVGGKTQEASPTTIKVAKIGVQPAPLQTTTLSQDTNPTTTTTKKISIGSATTPTIVTSSPPTAPRSAGLKPGSTPKHGAAKAGSSGGLTPPAFKPGARPKSPSRGGSNPFNISIEPQVTSPTHPVPSDGPPRPSLILGRASMANLEQADAIINTEKQEAVTHNIILQNMQSASVATDKPLTYLNIFKFFEELMDAKFEVDSKDLKARRKPRGMTEFLMEHLNRQFGIKALAMKFLGQLVPGIQLLYNENLPYAVLFARFLQVFSPDPIPFQLSLFLTRVRIDFHRLMEKFSKEREKKAAPAKKTKGAQPKTHGRAAYELAATGGEAYTSDVLMLIYDLFDNDHPSGELALELLRPEKVSHSDYVLFKLCHKMAKLGMNPEGVFNLIDADHGGSIDEEEFVKGIQSSLELWIPETEIRSVFGELATDGVLSKHSFLARCSFDWYYAVVRGDDFITTKCEFLTALITVFERRVREDTGMLIALYETKHEDPLSKPTLSELLRDIDPVNTPDRIEAIWNFGMEQAGDSPGLTQPAFLKTMLKYRSGQLAQTVFCKL